MTGFFKLNSLERVTKTSRITPHEVALALAGVNPNYRISECPADLIDDIKDLRKVLSRSMSKATGQHASTDGPQDANELFAAAYPYIDPALTPQIVKDRIDEAINFLLNFNSWREIFYNLGGMELLERAVSMKKTGRGLHRKEDEQENTDKLIALLVMLLAEKVKGKYGSPDEPVKSEIFKDIEKIAESRRISLKGVGKSTYYKKIEQSFFSLSYDE
ncbi:hypothetical protein [Serratia fonticola]